MIPGRLPWQKPPFGRMCKGTDLNSELNGYALSDFDSLFYTPLDSDTRGVAINFFKKVKFFSSPADKDSEY